MVIEGLHHVTAISGPPQDNVRFYQTVLRQRLIKKTVNFDSPDTYHLYYGDRTGSPGTVITFFPFLDAGPGRAGPGMASAVAYKLGKGGLTAAMEALADGAVDFDGPTERFGEAMIVVPDPDGMPVELIETDDAPAWGAAPALGPFHSVTLWLAAAERTEQLLTEVMGLTFAGEESAGGRVRRRLATASGQAVDLVVADEPAIARPGAGTIHHVAFRVANEDEQLFWRQRLLSAGMQVTPVIDRQYFNAIYFREPGGVLFEIATDPPGFAVDEPVEHLGETLKLPPQFETQREAIERALPPLKS